MPDETPTTPDDQAPPAPPGRPPSGGRRRAGRIAAAVATALAGVLVVAAVAWAGGGSPGGDGEGEAASGEGAETHEHGGEPGGVGADPAVMDDEPDDADGVDEPDEADGHPGDHAGRPAGEGGEVRRGARHDHPALAPYDERYAAATAEERAAADALLADVEAGLAPYSDVDAAVAAGYRPPGRQRGPVAHYIDPTVTRSGQVLDPDRPNGLAYYTGGEGDPVLLGAVFVAPPGTEAPAPAGDLVTWHTHDPACEAFFVTEAEPCTGSRRMLHVWTADRVDLVRPRTGRTIDVRISDPFGAPFIASVSRIL